MTEWIKCSERLPNRGDHVIYYDYLDNSVNCGYMSYITDSRRRWYSLDARDESKDCDVTHWAELPEPPND